MVRRRILLGALLGVLFAVGWLAGRVRASGDLYANLDLFVEVFHAVQSNYVDPVEPKSLVEGGVRGMLHDLDPYSRYLDANAYASLKGSLAGSFEGIGAYVDVEDGYPTVIAPIEGSPAWEAGILPGDAIVRIEGKSAFGMTVEDAADALRGPTGSKVTVVVARQGEASERTLVLERRAILTKCVPYAFVAAPRVGYLRLASFGEHVGEEVRAAIDTLRSGGARALVLDLRGNPGGLVEQAVDVAKQLVPPGSLIVYTKGRLPAQDRRYVAEKNRAETSWPVVVLVDGGSASASEIVAGALQDLDRGLVVGTTTFGKGSVQNVYPLRGGAGALKLTTALYYTPSGRSIHHERAAGRLVAADDDGDDAPADEASATDSTPRPSFRTAAGRRVFGGGGIAPDVVVAPDSASALVRRLDGGRLALRFANRWASQHPAARPAALDAEAWQAFGAFAVAESLVASPRELERDRPAIERVLRRELARRTAGTSEAARLALADDPAFRRALEVLSRARAPRDVFASVAAGGSR